MEKKWLRWLAPLALGAVIMGVGYTLPDKHTLANTSIVTPAEKIQASGSRVLLRDTVLNKAIRKVLNLSSTDTLYSDAFVTSPIFSPEAENPIHQIDFSNTGVTDIRELVQFEIPDHIGGINLAGNGITNEHLNNITEFLNCTTDSTISYDDSISYKSISDLASIVKKVNLNDNEIDFDTLNSDHLNNEKFIFGVQCYDVQGGLVEAEDIKCKYYVRDSDYSYMTLSLTQELSTFENEYVYPTKNAVTSLASPGINGRYTIKFDSIIDSNTAYFNGYSFYKEFIQFNLTIDEDFTVERNSLLDLKVTSSGKLLENSPINVDGFGNNENLFITYNNISTERITSENVKNEVNITLIYKGLNTSVTREINVVDTIKPVITLRGSAHAYSSQNKTYNDPGVIAYDPVTPNGTTGEDLTPMVVVDNQLDIRVLGTYKIIYTVSDIAGNTATIERIVEIQEQVLDSISLRTITNELVDGQDIVLVVQPDSNVDISKYKDIRYDWYMNDVKFESTTGDKNTGKSSITIIGDDSIAQNIYVKLTATQISDNASIELYSDVLELAVAKASTNNSNIILATAIVVIIALGIFVAITIIQARKGKGKTHHKHKNFHKGKKSNSSSTDTSTTEEKKVDIQVIKDYNGDNKSGSSGGGNVNFRPEEIKENSNKDNLNK